MTRRILTFAMALSLSLFASGSLLALPPTPSLHSTDSAPAKMKLISFSIRNDSAAALTLKAGEQQMTIAPGQKMAVKLEKGCQVTTVNGTTHLHAGDVLTTVTDYLQGNTLAVS